MRVRLRFALPATLLAVALTTAFATAAVAAPAHIVVWSLKSKYISKADALDGVAPNKIGQEGPTGLRVRVVLPADYESRACWPVLYVLHGTGLTNPYTTEPSRSTLLKQPFISIAPGGGSSWWLDHWHNGERRPQWERWFAQELIPTVERRLHVCPGRAQHSVAGLSMGGYGALLTGADLPQYFGTVGSISGEPAIQRSEFIGGYSPYAELWGPGNGQYAAGKNPLVLARNLRATRVFLDSGDGTPLPGEERFLKDPTTRLGEIEDRFQSDDFVKEARRQGVTNLEYNKHAGLHDYIDFQLGLEHLLSWGAFGAPTEAPESWAYRTIAQRGTAWGYGFRFRRPPDHVAEIALRQGTLTVQGRGTVTITPPGGKSVTAAPPFAIRGGKAVKIHDQLPDVDSDALSDVEVTVTPTKPRPKQPLHVSFRVPVAKTKQYFEVYANGNAKHCSVLRAQQGVQQPGARTVRVTLRPRTAGAHPKRTWCRGAPMTISVIKGKLGPNGQPTLGPFVGQAFVQVRRK
jgi:S-formylglutathione hydrolase FrmB